MRISIISFTDQGKKTADKIKKADKEEIVSIFYKPSCGVMKWAEDQFQCSDVLVFIGACGIAVRAIAPLVKDKLLDRAVIVIDEKGKYVIPILSGHVGGANETACKIAEKIGAVSVITTSTDINQKFAVDVFARKNGLRILNKDGIVKVSSKVLQKEKITMSIQGCIEKGPSPSEVELIPYPPESEVDVVVSEDEEIQKKAVLKLRPMKYVLGLGCKEGKEEKELEQFIEKILLEKNIKWEDIFCITSIDRKKNEKGILELCAHKNIRYRTFSVEELLATEGEFDGSDFVQKTVGVDNVCERAAIAGCGEKGCLIIKKQKENGKTAAVAKRQVEIKWKG